MCACIDPTAAARELINVHMYFGDMFRIALAAMVFVALGPRRKKLEGEPKLEPPKEPPTPDIAPPRSPPPS